MRMENTHKCVYAPGGDAKVQWTRAFQTVNFGQVVSLSLLGCIRPYLHLTYKQHPSSIFKLASRLNLAGLRVDYVTRNLHCLCDIMLSDLHSNSSKGWGSLPLTSRMFFLLL